MKIKIIVREKLYEETPTPLESISLHDSKENYLKYILDNSYSDLTSVDPNLYYDDLSKGEAIFDISKDGDYTLKIFVINNSDEELKPEIITFPISVESTSVNASAGEIVTTSADSDVIFRIFILPYEIIRIKVLDIRSGKPIKNAKVKRLIVRGSDGKTIGINDNVEDDNRSLQAQLKYNFLKTPEKYIDPGSIDGLLGDKPTEPTNTSQGSEVSKTRLAIRAFRENNGLSNNFKDDYKLEKTEDLEKLNKIVKKEEAIKYSNLDKEDYENDNNKSLQAKLKYIYKKDTKTYRDPGIIDGLLGDEPTEPTNTSKSSKVSKTRLAIRAFRENNGLSNNFKDDYKLEKTEDLEKLNKIVKREDAFQYLKNIGVFPGDFKFQWLKITEGKSLQNAKKALVRLGFFPTTEETRCNDKWDEETSNAYNSYWASRILDNSLWENKDHPLYSNKDIRPSDYYLDKIVEEYNGYIQTDNDGILEVRIPRAFLNNRSVDLDIAFWDFPITVEKLSGVYGPQPLSSISRSDTDTPPAESKTDYLISWIGEQKTEWSDYFSNDDKFDFHVNNNFGWQVSNSDGQSKLKAFQRLVVKEDSNEFNEFNQALLSKYYDKVKYPYHFVLFGMQWCSPIVDGQIDPDGDARTNESVFVNKKMSDGQWLKNLGMHIVTKHEGNSEANPYGHYYGFYDKESPTHRKNSKGSDRKHEGIDLFSGTTSNIHCFAAHGGEIEKLYDDGGYGNWLKLWIPMKYKGAHLRYAHLNEPTTLNGKHVLCGQIIATPGRTGFERSNNPSHLHYELRNYKDVSLEPDLINDSNLLRDGQLIGDPINAKVMPNNKLPLMLPCKCVYETDYINCQFNNKNILKLCWAVQEYPYDIIKLNKSSNNNPNHHQEEFVDINDIIHFICPFIFRSKSNQDARVQAQLKHIYVNRGKGGITNNDYFDLGPVDAEFGDDPENGMELSQGNKLILSESDHDGRLIKVKSNGGEGWIESNLIDKDKKLKIKKLNVLKTKVGKTRMAIYYFKKFHIGLDYSDYASNFKLSNADIAQLNEIVPIT